MKNSARADDFDDEVDAIIPNARCIAGELLELVWILADLKEKQVSDTLRAMGEKEDTVVILEVFRLFGDA